MDKEILEKLKLNKKNVVSLLAACRADSKSSEDDVYEDNFYARVGCSRKAPMIKFDAIKVGDLIPVTNYLFGQLRAVHIRKDPFTINDGIFDYTGKRWTDNDQAIYALYYLAMTSLTVNYFVDGEKGPESQNTTFYYDHGLIPTYSPDDPSFNLEDAKRALKSLGAELPD